MVAIRLRLQVARVCSVRLCGFLSPHGGLGKQSQVQAPGEPRALHQEKQNCLYGARKKKQVSELETPKLSVELGRQIRAQPDVEACEFWRPPLK